MTPLSSRAATLCKRSIYARDGLRHAVGMLLILPELERSADLAAHIAQRALTDTGGEMTPVRITE